MTNLLNIAKKCQLQLLLLDNLFVSWKKRGGGKISLKILIKTFLFATSTIVKNVEFEYILLSEKFFEMATQCSDITFHHPSVVLSLLTFNPENTRLLRVGEAAL